MPQVVKQNFCKLFADDSKLYGIKRKVGENSVQTDLSNMEQWSKMWQLPFNVSKCKVLHIGSQNKGDHYHLNGQELEVSTFEKDLGVNIDNELKFHVQSASATKKANQMLGVIKKSYMSRDAATITMLYKAMIRPHLEYGNAIWGPFYKGDIDLVEAVQHRVTKLIPHLRDKPYEERLRTLNLPSLVYRRQCGNIINMYKAMNGLVRRD